MHRQNGPGVVVIGDVAVDIIVPYPKFLNDTRTLVEYPIPSLVGGGTSANTAVALARLTVPTGFVGTVGDDQYGRYILNDFKNEGIDTSGLIVDKNLNTVGVFAFIDDRGERYLWGWPRVEQAFKIIDPQKVNWQDISNADFVHSSGMAIVHDTSARHTIIEVFKRAQEAGVPTTFDLNLRVDDGKLDENYKEAVLQIMEYSTHVLGGGDDEFYYLGDNKDWMETAKSFVRPNRTIVVRAGKKGCYGIQANGTILQEPAIGTKRVDTVGAGDVFNAGYIAGHLKGLSFANCLRMGNAVSGYTVAHVGARGCPTLPQLKEFLQENEPDRRLLNALG